MLMRKHGRHVVVAVFVSAILALGLSGCALSTGSQARVDAIERKSVEPLGDDEQIQLARALNLARSQQYGPAMQVLQGIQKARPGVGLVDARMGWVLQQQGRDDEAKAAYRHALEKDPSEAMAANNLALMLQSEGRFNEARDLFEAGLQAHPDAPELHYNLAVLAELYLLDLPLALEHYRRYQELTDGREKEVAGWIADLERRVN